MPLPRTPQVSIWRRLVPWTSLVAFAAFAAFADVATLVKEDREWAVITVAVGMVAAEWVWIATVAIATFKPEKDPP